MLTTHKRYLGFYVNDMGEVYSIRKGKFVRVGSLDGKYYYVSYYDKDFPLHRIVMEAYGRSIPHPNAVVRHINDNKLDNRPCNLIWGTTKDNIDDIRTNRNERSRLIRKMYEMNFSINEISTITRMNIDDILLLVHNVSLSMNTINDHLIP